MSVAIAVAVGLLLLCTLVPILRINRWWVRGLDFPRLQLSLSAMGLLLLQLFVLDFRTGQAWVLLVLTALCLVYQAWWILPYTRLYPREVRAASEADNGGQIAIMTANVLTSNRRADALLALVGKHQPDVLVTLESDLWWQNQLKPLEDGYPYTLQCPLANLYGMHVYSRLPLENAAIQYLVEDDVPSMHAEAVMASGRRVVLHFLHPAPPSPTENESSSERDAELLIVGRSVADYGGPTIVAGDLNDVAWSRTTRLFRKISGLLDPRIGRGMFNSFHAQYAGVRWPLDHLFHSKHFVLIDMQRLREFGSDHFPVLVRLAYSHERLAQEGLEADADDRAFAREKMAEESVTPGEVQRPESRPAE